MALVGLGSVKQDLNIAEYVQPDQILFSKEKSKLDLLELLAHSLSTPTGLESSALLHAFLEREKIVSTGLGLGVALPHARIPQLKDYVIAVALNEYPIAWKSLDEESVRVVFAIVGPDDKQIKHLQIISHLADLIRENYSRELLITAKTKEQVLSILELNTHAH